jgi:signal transduction histidine kinase
VKAALRTDAIEPETLRVGASDEDADRDRSRWRTLRGSGPQAVARRFLLAYGIVLALATVGIGFWVGQEIETGILNNAAADTALFVHSFLAPDVQSLATQPELTPADVEALGRQLTQTEFGKGLIAVRIWSRDGEVLYSPTSELVGQRFPLSADRARSFAGEVTVDINGLDGPEDAFERLRYDRLVEMFIPILQDRSGQVLAVAEFNQLPDEIDTEVNRARVGAWSIVLVAAVASFLIVAWVVLRAGRTIAGQQAMLRADVAQLSKLVGQVGDLNASLRNAGAHALALSVRESRRISADLHDGPGQALALALLQFDDLRESTAQAAPRALGDPKLAAAYDGITEALQELRAIAAGLRLPELAPLSIAELIERAVHDHERRTGITVTLSLDPLPADAPLAVKIGLFRALQETLSNATRHGQGIRVAVHAWADEQELHAEISDGGPGFDLAGLLSNGGLGLPGVRERTALAGGTFGIRTAPGEGTTIHLSWPLKESVDMARALEPDGGAE